MNIYKKNEMDKIKFFIEVLKVNKLTRLILGLVLMSTCLVLTRVHPNWIYPAIVFAIYPIWLTFWMLIYAWMLNPIREGFPNSWFTKRVIPLIDKYVDW